MGIRHRLAQRAGIKRGQVGQPLVQVADVEQVAKVGKLLIEDADPAAVLRRPIPAPAGAARVATPARPG